jgi:lipid-A-disaccharide synthase
MRYYLIVGEASGDLHASNLMKALQSEDGDAEFRFYGGDLMRSVGGTLVKHYKEMAYMGFVPVMMHLRTILRNMRVCKRDIMDWKPDVLILVDYPGFNLDIAKYVRSHSDIPIYYYISPKIWAWKEYRIKNIRRDVDELFSILPFEVEFYERHHYPIHYVGNPCVDAVEAFKASDEGAESDEAFRRAYGLSDQPIIAILAGSRRQEIKDNLRVMMKTAQRFNSHQFVIAGVPTIEEAYYRKYIPQEMDVKIVVNSTYRLLRHAEAALVTSGTATLETALFDVPQVVCYYTSCGRMVNWLRKLILKVKYISLVNLVVNREIVKELIGEQMNVDRLETELRQIVEGGANRSQMLADYAEMRERLGGSGASQRAARQIVAHLIG